MALKELTLRRGMRDVSGWESVEEAAEEVRWGSSWRRRTTLDTCGVFAL